MCDVAFEGPFGGGILRRTSSHRRTQPKLNHFFALIRRDGVIDGYTTVCYFETLVNSGAGCVHAKCGEEKGAKGSLEAERRSARPPIQKPPCKRNIGRSRESQLVRFFGLSTLIRLLWIDAALYLSTYAFATPPTTPSLSPCHPIPITQPLLPPSSHHFTSCTSLTFHLF